MYSPIDTCRACGNTDLVTILDLGEQALTGVFPKDKDARVDSGPLKLVKCHGTSACGLVQLQHTFSLDQMYGENYGYRSGLNPTMVRHLHGKVERILSRLSLAEGAIVVDIGSNDGTTLGAFPSTYTRIGIDPTASKFLDFYQPGIQVVTDYFSGDVLRDLIGQRKASVVTSFSMFYDLPQPLSFMKDIQSALAPGGIWVFEQSYLPLMMERNSYDTVCHEHLEYYSMSQIAWMAERSGLALIDVEFNDINGGSFSIAAGRTDDGHRQSPEVAKIIERELRNGIDDLELYASFADRVSLSRDSLKAFFADARNEGKTVGGLGASTKGNVILQYCDITTSDLVAIGEVNDEKFGAFTPGTLIPIWPEEQLLAQNLDYLLVLPWHFRETFMSKPITQDSKLVFPLPQLEVVNRTVPPNSQQSGAAKSG